MRFLIYPFHSGVEAGLRAEGFPVGAWRGRPLEKGEILLLLSPRFFPNWKARRWGIFQKSFLHTPPALALPRGVASEDGKFELYGLNGHSVSHGFFMDFPWGYILAPKASELMRQFGKPKRRSGEKLQERFTKVLEELWEEILPKRLKTLAPIPESHLPLLVAAGFFPYTHLGEEGEVVIVPKRERVSSPPISEFITDKEGNTAVVVTVRHRKVEKPALFLKKGKEVVKL